MDHLLTVAALIATATFATGIILPLTTRGRRGDEGSDTARDDEVAAAQLAARR